jgi:hypothetical protein
MRVSFKAALKVSSDWRPAHATTLSFGRHFGPAWIKVNGADFTAMGEIMKSLITLAALAAIGFAGAAYAGDATTPKAMSDSEMDKVTAGEPPSGKGQGINTAPPSISAIRSLV